MNEAEAWMKVAEKCHELALVLHAEGQRWADNEQVWEECGEDIRDVSQNKNKNN